MKKTILLSVLYSLCLISVDGQMQFTNNGNFMVHSGGAISFFGDFVNNSSYVDSGVVTNLSGSTVQQIGGLTTTTFKNLTLNNSAGSYLSTNESIKGELLISSGTFSTNGFNFTLISDVSGTARIAPILGNFSGNITMQRYIGTGISDWRFLATPVSGVTINDWQDNFVTSGFPGSSFPSFGFVSIYTYDETVGGISDYGYLPATSNTDALTPGKGYWCYVGPTPVTVDVTGPPIVFNHSFSVSYSPSAGASEDGYVMIGNPYPSPIDWSSAAWTKTNVNNAIYIWNPSLQQYASWVSGTATNGGSNLIASSQSFWVQTNGSNPVLSCTENIKVSTNTPFLKAINSSPLINPDILKLNISGNSYKDETLLQFGNGGTNGYDSGLDARKLFSTNIQVPGIASQDSMLKDLSINSLPAIQSDIQSDIHIPIKTIVGTSGTYTISIDSISTLLPHSCIVLEDLATGIKTNLTDSLSYSFFISDTTKTPRFLLHVSAQHLTKTISPTCSNYQDGTVIALAKGSGLWNYSWYNSSNVLIQQSNSGNSTDTLKNISAGTYSLQISDANGLCSFFKKGILVQSPAPVIANYIVLNDSLMNAPFDSLHVINNASGANAFEWNFGDGSLPDTSYSPVHHYDAIGEYSVIQIAKNGQCSDTLIQKVTVFPADLVGLSNNNIINQGFIVYPNPNEGLFHVSLRVGLKNKTILKVFTTTGMQVYEKLLITTPSQIDLKHLAKGIYLYHVSDEENRYTGKLIIE